MADEELQPVAAPEPAPPPADPTFQGFDPTRLERMGRNYEESFRSNTLIGAGITASQVAESRNPNATDEERDRALALLQDRQVKSAVYESMRGWDGPLEGAAALGGQLFGSILSPENAITKIPGVSAIGAKIMGRFGEAGARIGEIAASQGFLNAAVDPIQQAVDISAETRKEYSFAQTGLAFGMGAAIGGTFAGIGELATRYLQYRRSGPGKPAPVEQPKSDPEIAREDLSRAAAEDPSLQSNDIQPPPNQTSPSRAAEAGEVVPPSTTQPPPPKPDPEAVARQQNPDLFNRIDDLETRIDQTRAALDERIGQQSADAPDLVGGRRAELEAELAGFTGKRRSSPRAEALREELARLQEQTSGIVEAETARFAADEQMLRLRLNDLQQQRAALGPDYRAAMERAQQDIAARPVEAPPAAETPAPRPEAAAPPNEAATPAPEPVLGQTVADASPVKPTSQPAPSNVIPLPQRPKVQALDQIAAKVASGEASPRAAADEMRAALAEARAAAQAAPQTPAILNRLRMLDDIEREIAAATGGSTARDVEASVRQAFGRDGARLVDQGNVKIVQSVDQLPKRPDGVAHPDDVKGLYDGKTAYLVADNLTPGEARGVLLHEVGTHAGLRQMLGDNLFAKVLDEVEAKAKAGDGPFAEAARAVPEDTPAAHRAEEMLAYLVENAPELPLVQRVLASIRQWAYRFLGGRFIDLTEADLREMAVAALRQWKGETGPDGIVYSRGSSVGYRTGEESLAKYGLEPGERYNTRDIAAAMEARQRAKIGTIARDDFSDATAKKISKWMAEEVKYAVDQAAKGIDTGVGWYSGKFQRALDTFGDVFPELKTDKTKRDVFTAMVAIMSDGQKVHNNFVYAARMYDLYRQGKPLPTDVTFGGERSTSMNTNLRAINHLVEQYGEEGMGKYLMQEFTVSQLAKMAKEAGVSFSTSYKANQTLPMAALVFGPKLGAFYSNLMGSHGYLTMDRWWTRTFNRYRGQLLSKVVGTADAPTNAKGEPIGLARFKQMLGEPGISDEEALTRLGDFRDAYEAKGYKNGTDIEKAANTLYKDAFVNLEDQPFNASDREFMIKTANEAQKQLQKQGVDLSIADIQAVLWYYEKRLYGELGARQSADVSYEEAAARVVRESRGAGPDRWVAQDAGGDVIPGPDGSLVEVVGKQGPDAASGDIQQRRGDAARAVEEANVAGVGDAIKAGEASVVAADEPVTFRYSRGEKKEPAKTITVYHGSPHDFDRFSMDRIGTGEGAQAYGHGLYFAESLNVARGYRDGLTKGTGDYQVGGRPLSEIYTSLMDQADRLPPKAAQPFYDRLALLDDLMHGGDVVFVREQAANGAYSPQAMAWFEKEIAPEFLRAGRLYEVRINADPEHFLDWDKPLSKQSDIVRIAIQRMLESETPGKVNIEALNALPVSADTKEIVRILAKVSGDVPDIKAAVVAVEKFMKTQHPSDQPRFAAALSELRNVPDNVRITDVPVVDLAAYFNMLGAEFVGEGRKAARLLREAGIPGIKYLDAGSRAAGDGSRNYVVFDDSLLEITRKYSRRQADPEAVARQVEALKSQIQGLDRDLAGKTDEGLQRRTQTAGAPTQPGQQAAATTPPGETPEVLSLQQQSMKLAEVLDLPTYQGRVQGGQAVVGQFDPRQGVVRVRQIADFPTVAHEAAHAMEQRVGRPLQDLIQNYATELGPLDNTGNMNPREGFAIWAENWIINPATGPRTAPQFAQAFERTMRDTAPDVWTAMTDAQAAYKAWNDSSPGQKVGAIVQTQTPDTVLKTLKEEGLPRSVSLAVAKIYDGLFDDKSVVTQAVRSIVRMARDASGVKMSLEGADNPENLVRLFARNAQAATRDMLDGVRGYREIVPSTPGLRDAIIMATGQSGKLGVWDTEAVKTFSDYLVLRRAQVLYDKFDQGDLARRPLAMTKGDVLAGIAEMEAANPNLAAGAQMVHDYTRGLLKKMFDAGLIDADLFGKLMKEDFYVPLYRDMSDKPKAGAALSSSPEGPGRTDLVKRLQGSDRDIIDPIQSLMMQTFLVNRTVQHNDIIRSFVALARQAQALGAQGIGRILEEIPAHQLVGQKFNLQETLAAAAKKHGIDGMDLDVLTNAVADVFGSDPILATVFRAEPTGRKGEPIVFYKDGGQLKAVRFTAGEEGMALYEALSQLPPAARDWALAVGQMSASALRAGIVTNPTFALTNFIRDQMAAAILRPNYVPFSLRGAASELFQGLDDTTKMGRVLKKVPIVKNWMGDGWAQLYTYAGGVSPGAGAQGLENMVDQSIDALAAKGWAVQKLSGLSKLVTGHGVERIAGPAKALGEVVETAEAGTRLNVMRTVFEQKKAQGLSDYDAMIEAAAQATGLMDFGRHGSGTLYIRTLVPFLNAHLQGLDKAWQTMVTPVYRALKGDMLTMQDEQALKNAGLSWFKMAGVGGALGYMYSLWAQNHRAYQDANDELRATHLIIPGSAFGYEGKILVIPKPFELAVGFNLGEMAGMALKAGDPRAASFALAGVMEVTLPPNVLSSIPIVKNFAELTLNKSFFTKRDIVPERLQALKPEEQYTEKTSTFAKKIGATLGVSPIKVEYAIGSAFGLYGRDLLALSNTTDPNAPAAALEDQMMVRRFIKSADSASETTKRFWDQAAARNGQLAKAKATYENMLGQFRDDDAMRFLGALPKQERSFVVLNSAAGEDGKPAFRADDKRMHPLVRAATASTTINGMVRELSNNAQKVYEDGGRIAMDPQKRRDVIEQLRVLAAMEQYNALVIMKDKGYEGRRLEDTAKQLEVIRAHSSSAADEIMTRYATGKIPSGAAIAKVWPEMERRLLADGGKADIRDLTADVLAEGWEFGGERVKRPQKRRIEIPQRVLAPAQ